LLVYNTIQYVTKLISTVHIANSFMAAAILQP
jgi:hypothetical protein